MYSISGLFSMITSIPPELRERFIHDVCDAAELVQEDSLPLERIYGPVTFNELGVMNWQDKDPGNSWEAAGDWEAGDGDDDPEEDNEHVPTCRTFPISHIADLMDIPVDLLPVCLEELFNLSAAETTMLLPEQGKQPHYVWRDVGGLFI
jgi:hypothetical protein